MKKKTTIVLCVFIIVIAGIIVIHNIMDKTSKPVTSEKLENKEKIEKNNAEPEILHFVDVFGEEYETEILPDVPSKPYDDEAFIHSGYKLTYDDDIYKSRLGVDVSHHQGPIDWESVAADGYEFAILRIGYMGYGNGEINKDKWFDSYIEGAHAAGLDVGVYFFSQAINEEEAKQEADFVISQLEGKELELPVVYDPESILDDNSRTDNISGEQFTKNTLVFCEAIKKAGYQPMIYSNMLWEAFEFDMTQLKQYPFWYADYEAKPQTPYHFEYWQYFNEAYVNGINGVTDVDIQLIKK